MIQSIWSVINAKYPTGFAPSFTIIEIVGGDRIVNNKTGLHYGGRAIDVVPTADKTQNEYVKILSAFKHAGAKKAVCVDVIEFQEDADCDITTHKWIDHMHIEW